MDEVARFRTSSLPDHQKAALELAESYLTYPPGFPAVAREQLLRHFTPAQVVELLLKLSTWTVNKSMTALGFDETIRDEALTTFSYDDAGALVLHLPG